MTPKIWLAAALVAGNVMAQGTTSPIPREQTCYMQGEIYASAALSRDRGMPPETAYGIVSGYQKGGIPPQFLKAAINSVYFDPAYANARGALFQRQMSDLCLYGPQRYKPLK